MLSSSFTAALALFVLSVSAAPVLDARGCGPGILTTSTITYIGEQTTTTSSTTSAPTAIDTGCPTIIEERRKRESTKPIKVVKKEVEPMMVVMKKEVEPIVQRGCGPSGTGPLVQRSDGTFGCPNDPQERDFAPAQLKREPGAGGTQGCGGLGGLSCDKSGPVPLPVPASNESKRSPDDLIPQDTSVINTFDKRQICGGLGRPSCDPVEKRAVVEETKRQVCGGLGRPSCDPDEKRAVLEETKRQVCGGIGRPSCNFQGAPQSPPDTKREVNEEKRQICGGIGRPSCDPAVA